MQGKLLNINQNVEIYDRKLVLVVLLDETKRIKAKLSFNFFFQVGNRK